MAKRTGVASDAGKRKVPEFATVENGVTHPYIDELPAYVLSYHPQRWVVLAGRLVPQLSKITLVSGVNCVEHDKDGRVRFARARARLEEEGRTIIPYAWAPDGVSYIQQVETKPGGGPNIVDTWISVWETAHVGDPHTSTDLDAYAAWLFGLVSSGKLSPCMPHQVERMLERAHERMAIAAAAAAKSGGGAAAIRAEQLAAEVAVLSAAVKERGAAVAPKAATVPSLD